MSDDFVSGFIDEFYCARGAKGDFWKLTINGTSYGFGKYPPKCGEGSEVEFYIRWNGDYPNVDLDTFNIIDAVGSGPANSGGGGGRGGNGGGRGGQGGGGQSRGGQGGSRGQGGGGSYQSRQNGGGSRQGQGRGDSNGGGRPQGGARPAQGGSGRPAAGGGPGAGKDTYWADKEKRDIITQKAIQFQASRNSAIAALDVLLKVEAVKLPAKQADKYDAALALLDELTARFQEQTTAVMTGKAPKAQAHDQEDDDLPDDVDDLPEYNEDDE